MHTLLGYGHTPHQDDAVLQFKAPLTAVSVFRMPRRFRSEVLVMAIFNQFLQDDLLILMNHPSPRIQYTAKIMLQAMLVEQEKKQGDEKNE